MERIHRLLDFGGWRRRVGTWKHGEENGKALAHHTSPFYALTLWKGMVVGGNSTGELFMHTPENHRIMHVHKAPVFALFADEDKALVEWRWSRQLVPMGVATPQVLS